MGAAAEESRPYTDDTVQCWGIGTGIYEVLAVNSTVGGSR